MVSLDRPLAAGDARWWPLFGQLGVIDLESADDDLLGRIESLRVFAGYAGWSAGQLENEIAEGAWYVVDSRPHDLFATDPDMLRGAVLRRQTGPLSWLATCPADVELN